MKLQITSQGIVVHILLGAALLSLCSCSNDAPPTQSVNDPAQKVYIGYGGNTAVYTGAPPAQAAISQFDIGLQTVPPTLRAGFIQRNIQTARYVLSLPASDPNRQQVYSILKAQQTNVPIIHRSNKPKAAVN